MTESIADTKQRLLDVAIEEFASAGFDGATVREICRRADASINSVNYYFSDKQQLYIEAVKTAHRRIRNTPGIDVVDQIAEQFEGDPEQRLRAFVHGMVAMAMAAENRSDMNHQLLFREIAKPTVATEHIVREFVEPQFDQLMRILAALLPTETADIDQRLLALSVVGQCLHYKFAAPILPLLLNKKEQKQLTVERVATHIADVVMAVIRDRGGA